MVDLSIDTFKSKLPRGGARPNLFRVLVAFPSYAEGDTELTSFVCESAKFPASKTAVVEVPFRGRKLPLEGDRTFDPVTLTIINDVDHPVRKAFLKWKSEMSNHSGNTGLSSPVDYYRDITIEQLDKEGNVTVTDKLIGAWPESVGEIELGYDKDNEVERFTVELRYAYNIPSGVNN